MYNISIYKSLHMLLCKLRPILSVMGGIEVGLHFHGTQQVSTMITL